jgi:hypothetical protein
MMVVAGMIVGFDHDDVRIFQEQFDFLQEAGIAFTTCGVLSALEKTPLHARLEREGRLLPYDRANTLGHGAADLNFIPKKMAPEELLRGYNWLIRALYKYENYGGRIATALQQYTPAHDHSDRLAGRFDWSLFAIALKMLRYYVLTTSSIRRRFFIGTLRQALAGGATFEKAMSAVSYMVAHKHFHEYVTDTHGDPESVPDVSPFSVPSLAEPWSLREASTEFARRVKRQFYLGAHWLRLPRRAGGAVAVPEALLTERVGQCLRRYLSELGVDVVPFAAGALARLRDSADVVVLPMLGTVLKGREDLSQLMQQIHERVQRDVTRLPRVVHMSLDGDPGAVLDAFARIGLTFTRRIEPLREAYAKAIESMVPAPQPAAVSVPEMKLS